MKRERKKKKIMVILRVAHSTLCSLGLFYGFETMLYPRNQQGKCRNSCVLKVKWLACFYATILFQNHVS